MLFRSNSGGDRSNLQKEFLQLQKEVGRTIDGTTFNNKKLFDGSAEAELIFQVGAGTGVTDHIGILSVNMKSAAAGSTTAVSTDNTIGSTSSPTDYTQATNPTALVMQTVIAPPNSGTSPYPATDAAGLAIGDFDSTSSLTDISEMIDRTINVIDLALDQMNNSRATYGAAQNRFEAVISNLQVNAENQSAARGRIMDADFAAETANLSRAQILQQAGNAMVAQANQMPQQVLKLLQG